MCWLCRQTDVREGGREAGLQMVYDQPLEALHYNRREGDRAIVIEAIRG